MHARFLIPVLIGVLYVNGWSLAKADAADTPLETSMKHMSRAYKALSFDLQQPSDAHRGDYLQLAGELKTEAQTSRGLVPKKVDTLPADQQGAMVKAYQKSMDNLSRWIDLLTQDIQSSHWDEARKVMAAIKQQMISGHKDFRLKN
jgi:hypothetical protein